MAAVLDLGDARGAGLFAGALTNTPALAGVVDTLRHDGGTGTAPVVAYSLAYPVGVIGMLLAVHVYLRSSRATGPAERHPDDEPPPIVSRTYRVVRDGVGPLGDAAVTMGADVVFSRVKHQGVVTVAGRATSPVAGDLVNLLGAEDDVERFGAWLGERSDEHLPLDRRDLDFRRIFVSAPSVAGRTLASLDLPGRFGAVATRVRRGDVDLLANDDLVLELGDRIRVVGPRQRMGEVAELFGDSFRALGEVDVMTFSVGIALGMLLGTVPFPLPGGEEVRLGFAGGPLLVGLLLGALGRSGPLVWQLPHNANLTLRQIGTVLFLAGIGTRSGDAFASTAAEPEGLRLIAGGAVVTAVVALTFLTLGHRLLDVGPGVLVGSLAGLQTQPAVLTFAAESAGEHQASLGYATVFPLAMIAKIVLAQVVLVLL